jgi:hypothetical protein
MAEISMSTSDILNHMRDGAKLYRGFGDDIELRVPSMGTVKIDPRLFDGLIDEGKIVSESGATTGIIQRSVEVGRLVAVDHAVNALRQPHRNHIWFSPRSSAGRYRVDRRLHPEHTSRQPATTTQTTGEASRDPMVKKMNEDEKAKVETKGK